MGLYKKYIKLILFLILPYSTAISMEDITSQPSVTLSHCEKFTETLSDENMVSYFENSCRVDLHGVSESNAKRSVISVIQQLQSMGEEKPFSIHFITGRGNHVNSKGNRGCLFNNFPLWLEDEEISHLIAKYHKTKGAYEVFLKPAASKIIKDIPLKLDTIQKWAEIGDPQAQYLLGKMHLEGNKVEKDNKIAVQWLQKSAEQGFKNAQLKLGYLHAMGIGAQYNPQEALRWYHEAGRQGVDVAFVNIGTMYITGEGVPQNIRKAIKYYLKAAQLNNLKAMNLLGIYYRKIGKDEEAVKWDRKAAEGGEPHAKVNLGVMLLNGQGVKRDEIEGIKWLREAAEYGIVEGQMRLGMAYEQGAGVPQNNVEALRWFLKAGLTNVGRPSADAQWRLWYLYSKGKGLKHNEHIANNWLVRAADNGQPDAQLELARRYRFGSFGFECNTEQALKYYKLSEKQGNPSAQYEIGEMYDFGHGNLESDKMKSLFWMRKAAQNGHTFAQLTLGTISENELASLLNEINDKIGPVAKT